MTIYRHRQTGTVILWSVGASAVVMAVLAAVFATVQPAVGAVLGLSLLVLVACLVLLGSLTVEVTTTHVRLWFGLGWIRKSLDAAEIVETEMVQNPWYYGWGIQWTPRGWLFNVAGSDAVEIRLRNGRRYRIGTDEPHKLLLAIESVTANPR
jgi:hypothetical protein